MQTTTRLLESLRNKIRLDYPNSSGATLRQTLLSVQRQAIKANRPFSDERLEAAITPPLAGTFVWDAFWSLNTSRGGTGYGPAPLPNQEIYAWTQLYQQHLELWEINAIRQMDSAYLEEVAKLQTEQD